MRKNEYIISAINIYNITIHDILFTMKKEIYRHLCLNCKEEFDFNEKKENCSVCGKRFDDVVKYIPILSLGRYDVYECNNCKIRFETTREGCPCPVCNKPTIYFGYIWKCGRPSFFRNLLSWIRQF